MRAKKGDLILTLKPIFVIFLMLIAFFFPVFTKITMLFSKEYYDAIYLSTDLGLTLDTVYSFGGFLSYKYPYAIPNITLDVKEDYIDVYTGKAANPSKPDYTYPIIRDENIRFKPIALKDINLFYIIKNRKGITIEPKDAEGQWEILCPKESEPFYINTIVYYDPMVDGLKQLGEEVSNFHGKFSVSEKKLSADLAISLEREERGNYVIAEFPIGDKNRAFISCNILNILLEKIGRDKIQGANYIPTKMEKNTIRLKIGKDVMNEKDFGLMLGAAIYDSIK